VGGEKARVFRGLNLVPRLRRLGVFLVWGADRDEILRCAQNYGCGCFRRLSGNGVNQAVEFLFTWIVSLSVRQLELTSRELQKHLRRVLCRSRDIRLVRNGSHSGAKLG
jgi:hypothetical protein